MPSFGTKSLKELETCHPLLQLLFTRVVEGYDCSVLEGARSKEKQNSLYEAGKTKLKWPNSKHNSSPSLAVDVAPYPINWKSKDQFYHFVGYVKGVSDILGIKIRCGADWDGDNDINDQTFDDLPHFELIGEY